MSRLPQRSAQMGAFALTGLVLSGGSLAAAAGPASPLPAKCPAKHVVKDTIHQTVRSVVSRVRPIATVAQTGGFGAPSSSAPGKSSGNERTCTYTLAIGAPITITFSSPVAPTAFAAARKSTARTTPVTALAGLGDSAWVLRSGGLLFVLRGTLDIAISAPGVAATELTNLARAAV